MHAISFGLLLLAPLVAADVQAEKSKSLIGRQIPAFELHDYLGAIHKSDEWSDKKAIVVVFLGTECPVALLAGPRLAELAARYEDKGVAFVGIDSNAQDSLADIGHYARTHKIAFPILKDPGNTVADLFGAERTPDAFVLDSSRVVRYRGMVDNQYGVGYTRPVATSNYVADALDELLAGKAITHAATDPAGCHIGRVQRATEGGSVTYSKHVAPVFNQHCVLCHRTGQVGPFPLTSYEEAVGWAETIKEMVSTGRMPPWHANPEFGHFSNDIRLSDAEKELIYTWVSEGCPQGNASDLPEPPKFAEGWRIPKPDMVLKMSEPYEVPDRGTVPYQTFELKMDFPEERLWVQAAELRPGNTAITHHLVLFFHPPGRDEVDPSEVLLNLIAGFAPGMPPAIYSPAACRRVPAGSKMMMQCHYTPNGTAQSDQSEVGIVFADPKGIKKEVTVAAAINPRLRIPPGASDYEVEAVHQFREDTLLFAMTPHMHLRGKAFRFEAEYPDGRKEVLLDVPRYDFSWQNTYDLAQAKIMPEGTVMHCTGHFDNSADNFANPDPTVQVLWGDQTWQEMMVGTMNISSVEQDLSLGAPRVKSLGDGLYEAEFTYRPTAKTKAVYLAGDFNDWKTDGESMAGPDAEGRYTVKTQLKAGKYLYKFVLDGDHWRADPGNPERSGANQNSVLRVGSQN